MYISGFCPFSIICFCMWIQCLVFIGESAFLSLCFPYFVVMSGRWGGVAESFVFYHDDTRGVLLRPEWEIHDSMNSWASFLQHCYWAIHYAWFPCYWMCLLLVEKQDCAMFVFIATGASYIESIWDLLSYHWSALKISLVLSYDYGIMEPLCGLKG